jgi:protein-S-isoprenylcysteine O-methyltransferase Ste14
MNEKAGVKPSNINDEGNCMDTDCTGPAVIENKDDEPARGDLLVFFGNFFFKYRNIISPVVFCGLAFTTRPGIIGGNRRLDMCLDAVGIVILSAGQLLRLCVIGFAYIKRGGKQKKVYAKTLVQEGFFAHCRNPLYVGNVLMLIGLMVIQNNIVMYAIGLPFFLFLYLSITAAEENYLRGKFGQVYDDYTRRVPRFFISFKNLGDTLEGMKYDWKKVARKEYGTTFTLITTVMALLVWERIAADGLKATSRYLHFILILWIPVVVAYLTAFVAKKTGALGRD